MGVDVNRDTLRFWLCISLLHPWGHIFDERGQPLVRHIEGHHGTIAKDDREAAGLEGDRQWTIDDATANGHATDIDSLA